MENKFRWGILGTGKIARVFAEELKGSTNSEVVAVGSRALPTAVEFAEFFGISGRYGDYEELLAAPDIDAVYITTPPAFHAEWAIKAARAGKHVLCEKPMATNYAEAELMVQEARRNKVFLMEGFMYRCSPQTAKIIEILKAGVLGRVKLMQISFGYHSATRENRVFDPTGGGGAILDVGCYCASMARLIAGVVTGDSYAEPEKISALWLPGHTGTVDELSVAVANFSGQILGQLSAGISLVQDQALKIYGEEGKMVVPEPWLPGRPGAKTKIQIYKRKLPALPYQTYEIESSQFPYRVEAEIVGACVRNGKLEAPYPAMGLDDSLNNMKVLDQWRIESERNAVS